MMKNFKFLFMTLCLGLVLISCEKDENELFEEKIEQGVEEELNLAARRGFKTEWITRCNSRNQWHGTYIGDKGLTIDDGNMVAWVSCPDSKRMCRHRSSTNVWDVKCSFGHTNNSSW